VPLIVYDPDGRADGTRGSADARFVESVDVVPTILDVLSIAGAPHRIEGRSLLPATRCQASADWRDAAFAELDYAFRRARRVLGRGVRECRAMMVRTAEWKYVHWEGFRPQLFDLGSDPRGFRDLGAAPGHDAVRARMRERLFDWLATRERRTTVTDDEVARRTDADRAHGIHIGIW